MYYVVAALLCLAAVPVTQSYHEIHKRMTTEQVQTIFQTSHEEVPEYTVVQIDVSRIHKRDTRTRRWVKIVGADEQINLFLEPSDGILAGEHTLVTMADTSSGYLRYHDYPNIMQQAGEIMHDPITRSSFVISRDSRQRYALNGFIESRNMIVRSLPDDLSHELSRTARLVDNSAPFNNSSFHVIFLSKRRTFKPGHSNYSFNETKLRSVLTRKRRHNVPSTVYPEILLVVDYSTYSFHGWNAISVVRYLLALWNAVDMRFRNLRTPNIRLNIAHIIIAMTPEAAPYIDAYNIPHAHKVNAQKVLNDAGIHFYALRDKIPLDSYDVLMMMTHDKLTMTDENDIILGYAIVGGACMHDPGRQRVDSNGIFHDDGSYYSWGPAHEMGHLLGANHDGRSCPSDDGYLMTPSAMSNDNSWDFSSCSAIEIYWFFHKDSQSQCLYNFPRNTGKKLKRILPGSIMSIDEQCKMAHGTGACPQVNIYKENNICQQLVCASQNDPYDCDIMWGQATAEGTWPCNEGRGFCLTGKCIV